MKKKLTKWLSSTLVLAMIFTTIPLTHFSTVYATDSIDQSTSNLPQNQVSESTRKELVDKRTETSKTFLNPDGTLTTEISQKPIHFKNNRKEWQSIENELVENQKEQVYENKANAFKVKFDQEQKTDSPFMELEDEQTTVEFELEPLEHTDEMAAKSEAVVEGESITYPNVYQNIDIKYTIGNDRVKEDIIYNEKPSEGFPEQFTYKMNLNGMSVKESDGILYLYDDEKNEPLYYFDMPYMYDSFIPDGFQSVKEFESVPEEAMSYDIQLQHEVVDNQLFLHVIPNKEWLEDDNRVYPITIDPPLVKLQGSNYVEDTNIRSGFPTQTGGNDTELGAGRSGTNIIRGLLKFDVSSIPAGSVIISSNMNLWYSSTNNKNPINVSIHNVTKGWTENQANWNSAKTSPLTPWTTKGGDYNSSPLSTNIGLSEVPDLAIAEIKWDIPTSIIGNWINNAQNNNGLLLKSDSENTEIYKKFVSSEHTIGNQFHPKIIVTYKTPARLGLEDYWQYDTHSLL
ncbi:DNRLRE domain-containing protein [Lysinibacillus fusiformis]|nr:DNRLRE domain-containing protein [Lysinibacillus fusiformis]